MISPRGRTFFWLVALIALMVLLLVLFPAAYRFAEGAARSLVRLWWLVLLLALAIWLIWGVGRRPKP
jgi:hypothetical protein